MGLVQKKKSALRGIRGNRSINSQKKRKRRAVLEQLVHDQTIDDTKLLQGISHKQEKRLRKAKNIKPRKGRLNKSALEKRRKGEFITLNPINPSEYGGRKVKKTRKSLSALFYQFRETQFMAQFSNEEDFIGSKHGKLAKEKFQAGLDLYQVFDVLDRLEENPWRTLG